MGQKHWFIWSDTEDFWVESIWDELWIMRSQRIALTTSWTWGGSGKLCDFECQGQSWWQSEWYNKRRRRPSDCHVGFVPCFVPTLCPDLVSELSNTSEVPGFHNERYLGTGNDKIYLFQNMEITSEMLLCSLLRRPKFYPKISQKKTSARVYRWTTLPW